MPTEATLQREGKSPAVILAHGTGGVSDEREHAWAKRLNSWGIAAFVVDSYAGREIKPPIYADSPRYTHFVAHLLDSYLALQLVSTHPTIDGTRVAVMGFSRGGEVAVNAVFDRLRAGAVGGRSPPGARLVTMTSRRPAPLAIGVTAAMTAHLPASQDDYRTAWVKAASTSATRLEIA